MKRVFVLSVAIMLILSIISCGVVFHNQLTHSDVLYIAHRGYGYLENTEKNFRNAKDFYGIETDVRITEDGEFVLVHDPVMNFEDGTQKEIKSTKYEDIYNKTLLCGEKICFLKDYLIICKEMDKQAIIELKVVLNLNEIDRLLDLISKYYVEDRCTIISFERDNLINIKEKQLCCD